MPIVAVPASQVRRQVVHHGRHRDAPCPPRQPPDSLLKAVNRFRRNAPSRIRTAREAESEKLPLPWPSHRALVAVDSKLELSGDEPRNTGPHPLPRPFAPDVDVTVVRIPNESVAASLQLPVQLIEHDVTQQRRQRSASRRRPCASLTLHLHQVGSRTFTSKLSNMLGTHTRGQGQAPVPLTLALSRTFPRSDHRPSKRIGRSLSPFFSCLACHSSLVTFLTGH